MWRMRLKHYGHGDALRTTLVCGRRVPHEAGYGMHCTAGHGGLNGVRILARVVSWSAGKLQCFHCWQEAQPLLPRSQLPETDTLSRPSRLEATLWCGRIDLPSSATIPPALLTMLETPGVAATCSHSDCCALSPHRSPARVSASSSNTSAELRCIS